MTILEALILGIIQGSTEFLPVSSSGHLVLMQTWLELNVDVVLFDVILHLATISAVIFFFRKKILSLNLQQIKMILVGSIPAGVVGILAKDQIESFFGTIWVVGLALMFTGLLNLWADRKLVKVAKDLAEGSSKNKSTKVGLTQAFKIGLAQSLALIPGVSRSGSTVSTGLILGVSRLEAFQFSFLLSIPAVGGAGLLQFVDFMQHPVEIPAVSVLAVGAIAAFVVGLLSLYLFEWVLTKARLELFGWYCLSLGFLVFASRFF